MSKILHFQSFAKKDPESYRNTPQAVTVRQDLIAAAVDREYVYHSFRPALKYTELYIAGHAEPVLIQGHHAKEILSS